MTISAELRDLARIYRQIGIDEPNPVLKCFARRHALALAQVAEAIEKRDERYEPPSLTPY
jgi:hypothetical protein